MNSLVIFDLDGVLLDSREVHYHALNNALAFFGEDYLISREEHLSVYDGLPTTKKLDTLSEVKGLPPNLHNAVWQKKQEETIK